MTHMIASQAQRREHKHRRYSGKPSAAHYGPDAVARAERAYRAVQSEFQWLSIDQVRKPPRTMLDAKLARQIAVHLMVNCLSMEQRQIARLQGRQRTSIHFALQTVNGRLESPMFAASYERMEAAL
ncbi:hypothetical protein D4A92_19595 [Rhizobium rosettiformans]|uniref:Transposase n=1 Tax=Rhizobium rosettiformans TaxID=1368430 RepID=A0ABX7F1C2_9HYPH|nr:hypothetical protein [Rhizobium rosettiformans]QRF53491.1 hypothetical protein D4A92_19595 [Rhizobium rosettiformans]